MQNLHHITIASYFVDGQPSNGLGMNKDRKTAMGIYAADKPFSKGGKLTLRASIPAPLNGGKLPGLKEARAILLGDTIEQSDAWRDPAHAMIFVRQALRLQAAAVVNGCTPEEAARGYTFKEVRGDYVATVRKSSGNSGVFWLATLTHKGARIENDLRYNGAEQAQSLAVSWLNKHSPVEVEGPKEEAWNYTSGGPLKAAQHAIDSAIEQTPGHDVGATLTLDYPSLEAGYQFVMFATVNGKTQRNTLAAKSTDVHRLMAHWSGFVDNVRAELSASKGEQRDDLPALPHDIVTATLLRKLLRKEGWDVGALAAIPGRFFVSYLGEFSGDYASEAQAWQGVIALADCHI